MQGLKWELYACPVADTTTPLERDLSLFEITAASFSTIAQGGFGQADLELTNVSDALIEEALSTWLMKRVQVSDSAGNIPYEGFITDITVTHGHHTYTRSVDGFFNRAFVSYPYTGSPCASGATCYKDQQVDETDIDATYASQGAIGIKEEWFDNSDDVITAASATAKGKVLMAKVLKPLFAAFTLGGGSEPQENTISLSMLGAFATLQWRKQVFKYNGQTNQSTVTEIIKHVIATGGKAQYLNTQGDTFPQVQTINRATKFNTGGNPTWIQDYILGVVGGGDASTRPVFFQIAAGRIPVLYSIGNAPTYYSRAQDKRTYDTDNGVIPSYMVKAGGYVQASNLSSPLDEASDVVGRGRASLISETTYDCMTDTLTIPAPDSLMDSRRLLAGQRKKNRGKRN